MAVPASSLILLLPERRRFAGQSVSPSVGRALARADWLPAAVPGERAQLQRYFEITPDAWPMAALTRQADHGDAAGQSWLRADPVYVRPDMVGARLMAWGNLQLSMGEALELVAELAPSFADAGFSITLGAAERWYLRLPPGTALPDFAPPGDALGENLLAHLPQGSAGRAWRALLNEAQILLHNHPRNAARVAAGLPPVNSLWFWGGGELPASVRCSAGRVDSDDAELLALALAAGIDSAAAAGTDTLLDQRHARDWPALERETIEPALASPGGREATILLDFADGARALVAPRAQRWRWLRRPLAGLEP